MTVALHSGVTEYLDPPIPNLKAANIERDFSKSSPAATATITSLVKTIITSHICAATSIIS
ncbi:hypothetical protein RRF57_004067 [Xylaria bambusicola]|uniref:Uncharacterized protein n=1 Tax=Xylaria bambusicola TaxID=326684 RepID=A0AAN7Z3H5_9PEZI